MKTLMAHLRQRLQQGNAAYLDLIRFAYFAKRVSRYKHRASRRGSSSVMLAPRQHQSVDHALGSNIGLPALQLGVEKGNVKARIVRRKRRIADER